jgi:hypothetical protein
MWQLRGRFNILKPASEIIFRCIITSCMIIIDLPTSETEMQI